MISANSRIEDSSRGAASWRRPRRAKPSIVAASSNEGDETKEASEAPSSVTEVAKPAISEKRAQAEAEVKKGQRTAIVTGVISVLLGVGYLVLIQLLDTRGIILVPPPPEAFDP